MVTALDPIMRACGGTWVAHGSGDADRKTADAHGRVRVPPGGPELHPPPRLADQGAGGGLLLRAGQPGPLAALPRRLHPARLRPAALAGLPRGQRAVRRGRRSRRPATSRRSSSSRTTTSACCRGCSRRRTPNLIVAQFWHIPWPDRETFRTFPWKEELLDGLLGNDLLGFHLRSHCQNFLETVDRTLEAKVDHERFEVTRGGHDDRRPAVPDLDRLRRPPARGRGRRGRSARPSAGGTSSG